MWPLQLPGGARAAGGLGGYGVTAHGAAPPGAPGQLKVGDGVLGNWFRRGRFYPGKITAFTINSAGDVLYSVQYEDGDFEPGVPAAQLRPNGVAEPLGDFDAAEVFRPGDQVEGNWRGLGKVYPGLVTAVSSGEGGAATYTVRYDDGDAEEGIPATRIRRMTSRPSRKRSRLK